jgi:ABC-2 type transport system permease protein
MAVGAHRVRRFWREAWTIAAKDATEMWRDGRFRAASAVLLAVLGTVLVANWVRAASDAEARAEAQRGERTRWLDKGAMNPHAAAHYGAVVFKPVQPLSAIDPGLDPFVGTFVFLEAHQQDLMRYEQADDALPLGRGAATAARALQVLVPLLIVLVTAPAFAGEREAGTLRHLLSVGVSRASLMAGKALGTGLPLASVVVPASALGVAALWWTMPLGVAGDTGARALVLAGVYLASFALWAGVGLLVSAHARTSRSALAVLLGVWFTVVFVAPPMTMAVARASTPSTPSGAAARAIEDGRAALPRWDRRVEDVEARFVTGELALDAGMPSNPEVIALADAEADETALYDRHFAALVSSFDRQAWVYGRGGLLVPTLAVQSLSMALSGSDYAHHRRFLTATSAYRRAFLETLTAELASYQAFDTFDYQRGRELWERIPAFAYEAPRVCEVLQAHQASLAAFTGWLAAVGVALAWRVATLRAG